MTAPDYSDVAQSPEDVLGRNPFPSSDARHEMWKTATRRAETELAALKSDLLKTRCMSAPELAICQIRRSVGTFDIMARRELEVTWGDANIKHYDRFLSAYSEAWVKLAESQPFMHPIEVLELRMQLMQSVEHWKSQVRSFVSCQEAAGFKGIQRRDLDGVQNNGEAAPSANTPILATAATVPSGVTPPVRFPNRASWFESKLAERGWTVHDLQAQRGPYWKTSRKILDGLPVSRVVLERAAEALSQKKGLVRWSDFPKD
jgi:hypothetical protein